MSETAIIGADRAVSLQYTLSGSDGTVIESGQIDYLHGYQNIIPGLESALDGAAVGQNLQVEVPPELGYGERMEVEPQRVPREAFPADMEITPGMQFHARGPAGEALPVWVIGVEEGIVLIDPNHPLAGETLHFDVTILSVRPATPEEVQHGHIHGPDGHGHH
ncbi:MAG: peptidylprolyl isomerase [Myxococcota bacterium]